MDRSRTVASRNLMIVTLALSGVLLQPARAERHSPEMVESAIQRGSSALWSMRNRDGVWNPFGSKPKAYTIGPTALAAYALLESGVEPHDQRMATVLEFLRRQPSDKTYELGIRANVWLAAEKRMPGQYRELIERDALKLIKATANGAYSYIITDKPFTAGDNSNSQYGVLGVWAAAQTNIELPRAYWQTVLKHWLRTQNPDGGWRYSTQDRPKRLSKEQESEFGYKTMATMTAAGVASMYVCVDTLLAREFIKCRGNTEIAPIKRGLDWFDEHFEKTITEPVSNIYYYLYGVERVGLASGYKYFGTADWYRLGLDFLLKRQKANGSWGSAVDTAFALLFLIRGRHPIVFNKLQFKGAWNNRPRDLANLCRWLSHEFERTMNWQIINLDIPVREMHDAPLLYISSHQRASFTPEQIDKLRTFVYQGGTLLSVTEGEGRGFSDGIRALYRQLFPKYELEYCRPDHPIYKAHLPLAGRPKLFIVSNGVRPLAIHTDKDLAVDWQVRAYGSQANSFKIIDNLLLYVVGDLGDLRPRGQTHWPAKPQSATAEAEDYGLRQADIEALFDGPTTSGTGQKIILPRLELGNNPNPEPLVWERFDRLMRKRHQYRIEMPLLPPEKLTDSDATLAVLTGTGKFTPTAKQLAALKAWLEAGKTLLVDAAGGDRNFVASAEKLAAQLLPRHRLALLPPDSTVYRRRGMRIGRVKYRRLTRKRLGNYHDPLLRAVLVDEQPAIILSREDITAGLGGFPSGTIDGYEPEDAFRLMRNIVLTYGTAVKNTPDEKPRSDDEADTYRKPQWESQRGKTTPPSTRDEQKGDEAPADESDKLTDDDIFR